MSSLVRPMTAADLQVVTELDALSFKTPWPPKAFETELANAGARCCVAEQNGQVAAVLVLWCVLDEAHVATLAVHPGFRRRGIGSQLLQVGMDAAYTECARIYHLEVRSGNAAAQKLYQDFGFEIVGHRPKYYKDTGEDAVLMTKVVE